MKLYFVMDDLGEVATSGGGVWRGPRKQLYSRLGDARKLQRKRQGSSVWALDTVATFKGDHPDGNPMVYRLPDEDPSESD